MRLLAYYPFKSYLHVVISAHTPMIAANNCTSYSNAVEFVWFLSLNCNVGMQIAAPISGEYLYVTAQR